MNPTLDELLARFDGCAKRFLNGNAEDAYNVQLKIDHTHRVFELAERVARAEEFDGKSLYLTRVAALFHDVGRFPQYATYKTFSDLESENHARLGVRTLLREKLLDGMDATVRRTVYGAVFLHNVRDLPGNLRQPLDRVVRAVRDADKLDIIPLMLAHLTGDHPPNKVVTLGVKPHPEKYTPVVLQQVLGGKNARYQDMRWHNDFKLLVLSWIYDLNHAASARIFAERGYLERIFDTLPSDEGLDALHGQLELALREKAEHQAT